MQSKICAFHTLWLVVFVYRLQGYLGYSLSGDGTLLRFNQMLTKAPPYIKAIVKERRNEHSLFPDTGTTLALVMPEVVSGCRARRKGKSI